MILVTGAAGKTGKAVIRALLRQGLVIRGLVRREEQKADLTKLGVQEVQVGDLTDPTCVNDAVRGIQAIYHIAPNMHPDEFKIGQRVIKAASACGVEHFVFHSVLHPQVRAMPHHWEKLRVEEALIESGLPFTVMQPAAYMQNILAQWSQILERGIYTVPYAAHTRISLVDLEDIGMAAAIILTETVYRNASLELVGMGPLTQDEIATALSDILGRNVVVEEVSRNAWEVQARSSGLGDYQVMTLLKMFQHYEQFGFCGTPAVLSQILHRPPTAFPQFIAEIQSLQRTAQPRGRDESRNRELPG